MRQFTKFIPVLGTALLLAACGSSSTTSTSSSGASQPAASPASAPAPAVVKDASNTTLGATVLVDAHGLTLYHLSGEGSGKWICTSTGCIQAWHPLSAPSGASLSASIGSLGTTKRPDGTIQVTYKGTPLYTFVGDTKPGEAKGQGIKDVGVWSAAATGAAASTKPATPSPAPAPAPASSSGGSSYGY
jgi:predicted lipoprotein with Yx(FWY)xxD motif